MNLKHLKKTIDKLAGGGTSNRTFIICTSGTIFDLINCGRRFWSLAFVWSPDDHISCDPFDTVGFI